MVKTHFQMNLSSKIHEGLLKLFWNFSFSYQMLHVLNSVHHCLCVTEPLSQNKLKHCPVCKYVVRHGKKILLNRHVNVVINLSSLYCYIL